MVTVFKVPYVIGKWLNGYHYFSSCKRQIEVFSSVCFIAVCEILHSREKKSTYFLKIPRILKLSVYLIKVTLYSYLILKKMNEHITDS